MPADPHPAPEELHPALWRASQLARCAARCIDTGFPALSNQLPGGGWPTGTLVDVLPQQAGLGEMRLLAPALVKVASRSVVLLQPPHCPQILALGGMGLAASQVLWIKSKKGTDALWAAEQVLRSGSCGALLFWPSHVRPEALRRLNLAAQAGETLFFMLRPIAAAQDASPGTAASAAGAQRDGRGIRQAPRSTT
ncbi:translesion DNA synthesis-associated protein ImuA [Massilia sp. CCM 9210]|uniref:translesion DNA synthesis-associated protein ImuA n=1 Tax=Massilia scottii TaxID=3057166 RepID=UPI0027965FF1|nr:translesion DNA synthesis-associated protein ImuA [Massilia sp. CCM 9210]MDQ1817281.1 translesion DNA synthesis-associated protein ImuA [Massilia sp. CCM 9210]